MKRMIPGMVALVWLAFSAAPAMAVEPGESCSRPPREQIDEIARSMNDKIGRALRMPTSIGMVEDPPLIKVKIEFSPDAVPTNITVAGVDSAQERAIAESYVDAIKRAGPYRELMVMCYQDRKMISMQFDTMPVMY